MTKHFVWDAQRRRRLQQYYALGYVWDKIAEKLDCTPGQAILEAKRLGVKLNRAQNGNKRTEQVSISLDKNLIRRLNAYCKKKGYTKSHVISRLVSREMDFEEF